MKFLIRGIDRNTGQAVHSIFVEADSEREALEEGSRRGIFTEAIKEYTPAPPPEQASGGYSPLLLFSVALFACGFLLVVFQALVGKMALPKLGGSSQHWMLLCFGVTLLAGYLWSLVVDCCLRLRAQVLVHLGVLLASCWFLPVNLTAWEPPAGTASFSDVLQMWGTVGLPFFALTASITLLQKWFFHTNTTTARDPYFLFAMYQSGMVLGLLAYPALIEPYFRLNAFDPTQRIAGQGFDIMRQPWLWTVGFGAFLLCTLGGAKFVWRGVGASLLTLRLPPEPARTRSAGGRSPIGPVSGAVVKQVTFLRRLGWVGVAAVAGLVQVASAFTSFIASESISAIPLFLVVPVVLYHIAIALAFLRWPLKWSSIWRKYVMFGCPLILLTAGVAWAVPGIFPPTILGVILLSVLFAMVVLACYGELARHRPSPRHLTEFYLWIMLGEGLGGSASALFQLWA